jgi:phage terminase small subunit
MKPYTETNNGNIVRRTFSNNIPESELVWHRDHEDRVVLPLNENDWMVQFDNELPRKLTVGEEYFIPKNTFHRVIKGSGELQVEIIKTDFDEIIEEGKKKKKRDACYHKVRARYDVWPSAYASGALVKCRKVGAANWGNKSNEGEEPIEEKWSDDYKKSIDCNNPKGFSQKAHCDARKKRQKGEETKSKPVSEELTVYEAKKTDFSKEKSQGLHGWFSRKGGEGSSGWVDCNTCRKNPKTGRKKCKPCGRQEGEDRKYPACRPTPSACGTRGKGKKWGKKSTNEELNISENFSIFDKNYIKMILHETFNHEEPLVLPAEPKTKPKESPMIQPSRRNKPFLPERETQPDPKAKN